MCPLDETVPSTQPGLSYKQLKEALPFPTKIVTVPIPGAVLQAALRHSRQVGGWEEEKRAFLQVDAGVQVQNESITGRFGAHPAHLIDGAGGSVGTIDEDMDTIVAIGGTPFMADRIYTVALPRNLLNGFTQITPLMEYANILKRRQQEQEAAAAAAAAMGGVADSAWGGGTEDAAILLPSADSYRNAIDICLMHFVRDLWARLG
jgi:hypothetical protein